MCKQPIVGYVTYRRADINAVSIVEGHTWLRPAALYHFRSDSQHLVPELLRLAASRAVT
jgi:hypothetical protein